MRSADKRLFSEKNWFALCFCNVTAMDDAVEIFPLGIDDCYAARIDEMNFQIFNADGKDLGLVWEVTGDPGHFRCVPTSNTGRPIRGGTHRSLVAAGRHCIANAIL
jgi:hypothetical protein